MLMTWWNKFRKAWRRLSAFQQATLIIQSAGVVVVLVYTVINWRLYRQTKQAVYQTTVAAQAAEKSVDSSFASVRAWMVPVNVHLPSPEQIKQGIKSFTIDFHNAGKTPASNPTLSEAFVFWKEESGHIPTFHGCPASKSGMMYGPMNDGQTASYGPSEITVTLDDKQRAALANKQAGLFIHVCVEYGLVLTTEKGMTDYCSIAYLPDGGINGETLPCPNNPITLK